MQAALAIFGTAMAVVYLVVGVGCALLYAVECVAFDRPCRKRGLAAWGLAWPLLMWREGCGRA